jgi:hypothetical protein
VVSDLFCRVACLLLFSLSFLLIFLSLSKLLLSLIIAYLWERDTPNSKARVLRCVVDLLCFKV